MSSHHRLGLSAPSGEIQHFKYLSDQIGALYLNDEYSDVVLKIEGEPFYGHKAILAARSEYFRALLFGGMKESLQSEIELKGTSLVAFKCLLKYMYTGHMSLASLKEDVVLDVLGLAHQYGFVDLETSICDYLHDVIQIRNVCVIYDAARLYQLKRLVKVCCNFVDRHTTDIIHHETFLQLSPGAVKELMSRNSFYAPEVEIFRALCEWVAANPGIDNTDELMSAVRLPLMSLTELLTVVRPTGLVSPDLILDAIQQCTQPRDSELQYRGCLIPEENVAQSRHGTQVLHGEMRSALLDGDSSNYDMERGYTRHAINEGGDPGILIKLGSHFIINHIKMLLWDRDERSYSYYIEVSMDQKVWVRVIDHVKYYCRSWQFLHFPSRVVRYIRIVGTHNTVNKVFHVVSFEAMFTHAEVKLEQGLIVPRENVATVEKSATVIEGVSRTRNALLNGDVHGYDWDRGYTCHQLGSGALLVQLGQPYMLHSMRLLLWDCDDRRYSYYVEVSVNMWDWDLVADKTRTTCSSWQLITFEPRPVVFVRIVGTFNTANEVFHCVHFECPAMCSEALPCSPPAQLPAPTSTSADAAEPADRPDALDEPADATGSSASVMTGAVASAATASVTVTATPTAAGEPEQQTDVVP